MSFILSMIPSFDSMSKRAITKLFNTILMRAGITLIITTAFSISTMLYSLSGGYPFFLIAFLQIVVFAGIYFKLGDLMSMFSLQSNDSQSVGSRIMRRPRMLMHAHMHRLQRKLGRSMTALGAGSAIASTTGKQRQSDLGSSVRTQADHTRPDGQNKPSLGKRIGQTIGSVVNTKDKIIDSAGNLKEQVQELPTNARYAVYQGKSKAKENVRDLTSSISQTRTDRASGRKEQQEQRRKTIADHRFEMEQAKQQKQPASSVHKRPVTRHEQSHEEQSTRQATVLASHMKSQREKQERPTVKPVSLSSKGEHQNEPTKESTIQKRSASILTVDKQPQHIVTKERPSTTQRVQSLTIRNRPQIKSATMKRRTKKP